MSYKDSVKQCVCMPVCMCASVCVCVHNHKGKLLSTSNQGPNQHPIAHPHNLSLYLSLLLSSFPFPLPLPRTCFCILPLSLPSSPLLLPFPSSCTSLEMAAATVAAVVVVTWCRAGGDSWECWAQRLLSFRVSRVLSASWW